MASIGTWTVGMALAASMVACSPADAASYGCGRLMQANGERAAVLVLQDAAASSEARDTPRAGAVTKLALTVCGLRSCDGAVALGPARPLALGWEGNRLTVFADPPAVLLNHEPSARAGYELVTRPLGDAVGSGMRLFRFEAAQCRRRSSAGG